MDQCFGIMKYFGITLKPQGKHDTFSMTFTPEENKPWCAEGPPYINGNFIDHPFDCMSDNPVQAIINCALEIIKDKFFMQEKGIK